MFSFQLSHWLFVGLGRACAGALVQEEGWMVGWLVNLKGNTKGKLLPLKPYF